MNRDELLARYMRIAEHPFSLDPLGETRFQAREAIRQRFAQKAQAQVRDQVGTKSGLSAEQQAALSPDCARQSAARRR